MRILSLAVVLLAAASSDAATKDPLRFLADSTDIVLKVEQPRALVEAFLKHDLAKDSQQLQLVRDFLDGADYRKFFQILAHFEKQLGVAWPEMIDKVAGAGMAVGLNFGSEKAPALLAIQGTDEKAVAKFLELGLSVFEDELTRLGVKEMPARRKYAGIEVVQFSEELLVARIGDALLLSNKADTLKAALDRHEKNVSDPKAKTAANSRATSEAGKILPPKSLAWLWVNLKPLKELPESKALFETPRNEIILTLAIAGYLDVAKRSDFAAAGLYHEKGDFQLTVRLPAGRDGMATDVELHQPRDAKVGGTLPLLEPKGVPFSHSFYFDLDTLYKKRDEIFPAMISKDLAEGEKQISRFLLGTTLPKFLANAGVHYRLVAAQSEKVPEYKTEPGQRLPSAAVVISMRDKQFGRTMNGLVRAGALALGEQISYRSWEEEIAGINTFGYSFPEGGKFPDDPTNLRFNYQPTFGIVGDQYVVASNKGLFKELVGLLQKEDRTKKMNQNMQMRFYAAGVSEFLYASPDSALADNIIGQGLKLGPAKEQTQALLTLLKKLGTVSIESNYDDKAFQFDLRWKTSK